MADVVNFVETFWTIKDQAALNSAKRMQRQFGLVAAMADRTAGAIRRLGRAVISPLGLSITGAGFFGVVKHLLQVGDEADKSRLKIAALLQQTSKSSKLPFRQFDQASEAARQLGNRFKELSVVGATSKEIQKSFEQMTVALSKAGVTLDMQAEMARNARLADKAMGGKGHTQQDVGQLLAGQTGNIQNAALRAIRFDVKKLVKKKQLKEAAALIHKHLRPDPKLLAAYGNTFGGLVAAMKDQLGTLKEEASKPLMEYVSKKLKEWLSWLKNNRAEAKRFARAIGRGVVRAVQAVVRIVKWLANNWETIVGTVKTLATVWIGARLVGALTRVIGLARTFGAAMSAAAVKAGIAGSRLRSAGRLGGIIAAGVGIISEGEAIGTGLAKAMTMRKDPDKALEEKGLTGMSKTAADRIWAEERKAHMAEARARRRAGLEEKALRGDKKARDLLKKEFGATVDKPGGGGGRRKKMRVGTLLVDKMSARDRDFARLSTPASTRVSRDSYARRPLAGAGLAVASLGR